MALRNSAGARAALFVPEQAFVSLVRRQIQTLKPLGRLVADEIYDERKILGLRSLPPVSSLTPACVPRPRPVRKIVERCEPPGLGRFGSLRERAVEVVHALLKKSYTPTTEMIDRLLDIERACRVCPSSLPALCI